MAELLIDPDVEAFLVEWLPTQLATLGVEAKADAHKGSPKALGPHIQVRRLGGRRNNRVVDRARVWLICEGPDASGLAKLVRALINSLPRQRLTDLVVYRVEEVSGISNMPGLHQSSARYGQTFEIYTRSKVLSA